MAINPKVFLDEMNRLIGVFGNNAFNQTRLSRIKEMVSTTPEAGLKEIVDNMIDSFRHAPLPKDFADAVRAWKTNNYLKQASTESVDAFAILCLDCQDTGLIYCKMDESSPNVFVFCHCERGENAELGHSNKPCIPRWEKGKYEAVYGFIKLDFPSHLFTPTKAEQNKIANELEKKDGKPFSSINPKMNVFGSLLTNSQKFFSSGGTR